MQNIFYAIYLVEENKPYAKYLRNTCVQHRGSSSQQPRSGRRCDADSGGGSSKWSARA